MKKAQWQTALKSVVVLQWSLGCILYELVVGATPFDTQNLLNLINKVRNNRIEWPSHVTGHCR